MKIYLGKKPGYADRSYVFPFIKNMITFFEKNRIEYTFDHNEKSDIALCVQWEPPLRIVKKLRKRGTKIVHRLDGRAKSLIKIYDKDVENRKINRLADWTVYQSAYVKKHTTEKVKTIFGVEPPVCQNIKRSSIIYNGVDRNVFNELGETISLKGRYNLLHVAFTAGVRKGTKYVIKLAELLKNNPEFHFYLIGRQEDDLVAGHLIKKHRNITALGVVYDRELLAKYMKSAQILLFPSENDYCPNTVLEAMSCSLPVLFHNSGGTPELVCGGDFKSGVVWMDENPVYPVSVLIENMALFRANALKNVECRFTLDMMGDSYLKLFENLMNE